MFDVTLSLAPPPEQQQQLPEEGSPNASVRSSTVVLRRDYQEFRALHLALTSLFESGGKVGVGVLVVMDHL